MSAGEGLRGYVRRHWDAEELLTLSLIPVAQSTTPLNGRGHRSACVASSSESSPELWVHVESGVLRSLRAAGSAGRSFTPGTYATS